jgi:hypothetical protein
MEMRSFWQVFISPTMTSRAMRPSTLMVPSEILRLVTKERMSFSDALVCNGIYGCSRTLSSSASSMETQEQLVELGIAGTSGEYFVELAPKPGDQLR